MLREMRVFHELGVSSPSLYIFRCQLEKLKLLETVNWESPGYCATWDYIRRSLQALIMSEMFIPDKTSWLREFPTEEELLSQPTLLDHISSQIKLGRRATSATS
jgi:hypothetical protein